MFTDRLDPRASLTRDERTSLANRSTSMLHGFWRDLLARLDDGRDSMTPDQLDRAALLHLAGDIKAARRVSYARHLLDTGRIGRGDEVLIG
jgi:hypothetical protein